MLWWPRDFLLAAPASTLHHRTSRREAAGAREVGMRSSGTWVASVSALTLAAALLAPRVAQAGTPAAGFTDEEAASGLSEPTAIAFLPDGSFLVTEKRGGIKLVVGGVTIPAGSMEVCTGSEMGLLGIAIDPAFALNGRIFLYRTEAVGGCAQDPSRTNQVVSTTFANGEIGELDPILTGIRTDNGNHDGGGLRIGPDGKLYVGVGDTGIGDGGPPGASTNPYSQSLGALEGKILRLELDGSAPSDNPFFNTLGARPEIFAYGFRNPFRFGFDPLNGALWVGDVGQNTIEEIDRVAAGENHSWPYCEGSLPVGCARAGDGLPAYEYPHDGEFASVTGGAFAVGGDRVGEYYFADFVFGIIWRAVLDQARERFASAPDVVVTNAGGPADLVFGPDGALYYVAYAAGHVRRLGSPGYGPPPTTTTVTTTTTTLPPSSCGDTPTFSCVRTDLAALASSVAALGDLGRLDERLAVRLRRARTALDAAEELAADDRPRAARAWFRRALRALSSFRAALASRAGRRHVDLDMRSVLATRLENALSAVRTLRAAL
jgi:glucose/arabinose dehydrogenase